MYRLAIISIDSGHCIANPIYSSFENAEAELNGYLNARHHVIYRLDSDCGKIFFIPVKANLSFVIESAESVEDEYNSNE